MADNWTKEFPQNTDIKDAYYFVRRIGRDEVVNHGIQCEQGMAQRRLLRAERNADLFRSPACPLHFGLGYKLDCLECRAMPTIMPDGSLRDSIYAATTDHLRRWAREEQRRATSSTPDNRS